MLRMFTGFSAIFFLMLTMSDAFAERWCRNLKYQSAEYYACESLRFQENKEAEKKWKESVEKTSRPSKTRVLEESVEKEKAKEEGQEKLRAEEASRPTSGIPRVDNYGTDKQSSNIYLRDLERLSAGFCRRALEDKIADGAFCLSRKESGAQMVAMLRIAAELGHPYAQSDLAHYLDSDEPIGNSAEIARLIKTSAKYGIADAQVSLGWWHMTGEHGISVDYAEAMKWNLLGYKQGHSEGANNIGGLYEKGLGVRKDLAKAKSWYKKSSVLGNQRATERLEQLNQ